MRKLIKKANTKPNDISTKNLLYIREMKNLKKYFKLGDTERARKRPSFNMELLRSSMVIQILQEIQNHKCAYCETHLKDIYTRTVSHYRPLSNATDPKHGVGHVDCYAWFAYEWQNLMLICDECNSYKLNYFPISGQTAKAFSSWRMAQNQENPLLLNPFEVDPFKHLMFDTDGVVVGSSETGKITIELLNLNRIELKNSRKKHIQNVLNLIINTKDAHDLSDTIREYIDESLPYSGAIKNSLQHVFRILQKASEIKINHISLPLEQKIIKFRNAFSSAAWREAISRCQANHLEFRIQNTILNEFSLPKRYSYIRRLEVRQFKGIKYFSLDFDNLNSNNFSPCVMLLGENATGKSSILQAIALALMDGKDRRRLPFDRQGIIPHSIEDMTTGNVKLEVIVFFNNGESSSLILDQRTDKFKNIGTPQNIVFGYGSRRYFLSDRQDRNIPCPSKTLFNQAASLPDPKIWLLNISENKFNSVARALSSLLTLEDSEFISRNKHSVFIQRRTSTLPISHLSDGYKSLFAMAVDIMREMLRYWDNLEFAQGIVLIDEIENHLHPRWKMRVISALRNSLPRVQFIVSTHDPLCLRGMYEGEVKVLYQDRDGSLQYIDDLPNVANLRIDQILTSDYFGLATTEDPMRQQALEKLATLAAYEDSNLSFQDRKERDELLENYGSLPVIGDTIDRQIIAKALTRHIRETELLTPIEYANAREESVREIIKVLERNRSKYDIS